MDAAQPCNGRRAAFAGHGRHSWESGVSSWGGGSFGGGIVPKNRGNLVTEAETVCNQLLKSLKDPHPTHSGKPTATIHISGHSSYPQFRTCTCMHYTFNDIKSFLEKGGGGFCNPTSYRDCRIFVIFWDLTRQDMCIRRTRRNMWMRWKVEHWSSNRFDASWCFPNLRHKFCKKIFASQQSISVTFGVGLYAMLCQPHFDGIGFHTFCYLQQKNMPIDFLHYSALYVMRPHSTTWLLRLLPPTATAADILNKDVPSCEWKDLLPQIACISRHIFTLIAFVSLLSDILNKDVPAPHWKVLLLTSANKQSWQANPVRKHKSLKSVFLASLFSVLFPFSFHCQSQPSSIKSSHLAFGNNLFHWGLYWTLCIV